MKASLTVALAIAGACVAGRAAAQTVVVGPQAGSIALRPGATVTVPIMADLSGSGGASLGSATARLLWQPGVLAYLGASGGTLGQPVVNADSAGGSLRFAVANPAGVTGQPVLLSATFAVVGAAGVEDTLRLQLQELTRAGTFADLLPSGVATTAHLCVSTGDFGDLNADLAVTSFDALLMITNAVGLPIAPYTVVNGDVDADGQVTTRDALIALSYAIELPVDGFRVGRMNPGTCSVQTPASVQIAPATASVAVGDQFPLTATVRDSAGAPVQGVDLVWTSADTAVVKADATGHLVGTKAGTAKVFAFASPGLRDSATVTVDSLRRVWWVDPALAALNSGVELGSMTYPFSSIGQALARAADNDTVHIAPATYGETVRFARPLTLVGDSTAGGVTTIRNPTGAAIAVDSLPGGGLVRIEGLRLANSQGGVRVQGSGTGVVSLSRVEVGQSTAAGISATGVARLELDQVMVDGAVQTGIRADLVPQVRLHAVGVSAVSQSGTASTLPVGVRVAGADSLLVDSVRVVGAGVWVDSAHVAAFSRFNAVGSTGPAVAGRFATSFVLDGGDIQGASPFDPQAGDSAPGAVTAALSASATARIANVQILGSARQALFVTGGDSVLVAGVLVQYTQAGTENSTAAKFEAMRRLVVEGSSFLDNGGAPVVVAGQTTPLHASIDTSAFRATPLVASVASGLEVRRSLFEGGTGTFLQAGDVDTVALWRVDLGGMGVPSQITVDGGPSAVSLFNVDTVAIDSVSIHDNPFGALACQQCVALAVTRSQFVRNGSYGGQPIGGITNVALLGVQRTSFQGVAVDGGGTYGLWLQTSGTGSRTAIDSASFSGPEVLVYTGHGAGPTPDTLRITRSVFQGRSGIWRLGLDISAPDTGLVLSVTGSAFDSLGMGIRTLYGGPALIYGNRFAGDSIWAYSGAYAAPVTFDSNTVAGCMGSGGAVALSSMSGRVTRNTIWGCQAGVWSESYYSYQRLAVTGNTIQGDSATARDLVHIKDTYDSVAVVGNTITGGRGIGVHLYGYWNGIGAARVDSNTVQGILGNGLVIEGSFFGPAPQVIYNVVADNDSDGVRALVPLTASANTVVRNGRYGLYANSIGSTYLRSSNIVGNVRYGVWNDYGEYYVFADSSYWGSPIGPSCISGCNPAAGDSITIYATFAPYSSAPVVGAPPIPAQPGAPPFRASARPAAILPAQPVARPRPTASVQPRRAQP